MPIKILGFTHEEIRDSRGLCPGVSPGVTVAGDEVSQGEAEAREMASPDE